MKIIHKKKNGEKYGVNLIYLNFLMFFKLTGGFILSAHTNVNSQEIQEGREQKQDRIYFFMTRALF